MNIAYFITEKTKESNIWLLKRYYENDNFFTISNDIRRHTISEIASVNIYYTHFMSGKIIFDNMQDFLSIYETQTLLPSPVLFIDKLNIEENKKHLSKFDTILVLNNNKIERINHEAI